MSVAAFSGSFEFLGSKISLITETKIRYEGILYRVDTQECTLSLSGGMSRLWQFTYFTIILKFLFSVRSFGTEDRISDRRVTPRDEIYTRIAFKGLGIYNICVAEDSTIVNKSPYKKICEQLGELLDSREFSDIELKCGEKVFNCHQVILSAGSPVFKAMFQTDMEEKKTKVVTIKEMEPEVLAQMVYFMYTGESNEQNFTREMAKDLYEAADRYQVAILKIKCEENIYLDLRAENAIDTLMFADLYQSDRLKEAAMKLIVRNEQ